MGNGTGSKIGRDSFLSCFHGKNQAGHIFNSLYRKCDSCNNTALLSLFKEMKHFELKYRVKIIKVAS